MQSRFSRTALAAAFAMLAACMITSAQTTNGLMTGVITDSSGASVPGAQIAVTNQGTGLLRTTASGADGIYVVPQLPPGTYAVSVKMQGFATEDRSNIQLQVNQNATIDFQLKVSSIAETINVTGAPPPLNTTSATLSDVIGHSATVDLPLNGREFTQLTLLTPGAAPIESGQQKSFTVALGAGGISPAVNGQRGQQNNFTMDGVLNNATFTDTWAISPPPDALQEFNVQSHITDAQFAISSGANINIVSRSGTNDFHGSAWEFIRNDALDAQTFPAVSRLPYRQNQYGVFFGGPVLLPHFHGRDNTWFAAYWEGFRSTKTISFLASVPTAAMRTGDFSAVLGPQGQDEIFDPATSVTLPNGTVTRQPFPGNIIPSGRINPDAPLILAKYYPLPNLNVAAGVLPNYQFSAANVTASDVTGIRIDHRFGNNDTLFGRYNRSNANLTTPEPTPGYVHTLPNYAQTAAGGYTHLFGTTTILNLRYGYTNTNFATVDEAAGPAFVSALNFAEANPEKNGIWQGPQVTMANGYTGVSQTNDPLGPQNSSDYHADLSKVKGNHTLGIGGMVYHLHSFDDGWLYTTAFTQNATSQGATAGPTGYGPASFMLGLPDSLSGWLGNTGADQTMMWYGGYAQDQWHATKNLTITAGLRYDYITPANFHKIVSALDAVTGQFIVTQPYPPLFPKATGPSGFYYAQYNGFEPRFGVAYQASPGTVVRGAFAMLDDHNNSLVQKNQSVRLSWPTGITTNVTLLNRSNPSTFINSLPPASSYLNSIAPYASFGADPNSKIPYSMEYNFGIERQLPSSMVLNVDYVGSVSRHLFIQPIANTAPIPGPGSLASRGQPFSQYGGPFNFSMNGGSASYNAFQAKLSESLSSGLFFLASYTWSKSMDIESAGQAGTIENVYDLAADWGPSDFNLPQMFVFSGVYALPVGQGKSYLSRTNKFVQTVAGNWSIGSIVTLLSGDPFNAAAGGDVANVGGGTQRAEQIGNPYSGPGFQQTSLQWLNKASFETPAQYTFGNESRNNLIGPPYKDVDFNIFKDTALTEHANLQFRAEFFNIFNHTNYATPTTSVQSAAFGRITSAAGNGREIQFGAKLSF